MASVSVPGGETWIISRQGFALLIDRAQGQLMDKPHLLNELEGAKALDGLHLELISEEDRTSLAAALIASIDSLLPELDDQRDDSRALSYVHLLEELRGLLVAMGA
jgi:hypothetical protein